MNRGGFLSMEPMLVCCLPRMGRLHVCGVCGVGWWGGCRSENSQLLFLRYHLPCLLEVGFLRSLELTDWQDWLANELHGSFWGLPACCWDFEYAPSCLGLILLLLLLLFNIVSGYWSWAPSFAETLYKVSDFSSCPFIRCLTSFC